MSSYMSGLRIVRLLASIWLVDSPFSVCQRRRLLKDEGEEVGALVTA